VVDRGGGGIAGEKNITGREGEKTWVGEGEETRMPP